MPTTQRETPFLVKTYRFVRSTNRAYAFVVLWCYIAAFALAFALMFVFPPGTLLMVFLGVFGLVAAVGGGQLLGGMEHGLARLLIGRDRCPRCGRNGCLRRTSSAARGSRREAPDDRLGAMADAVGERTPPGREETVRVSCSACAATFESWGGELDRDQAMAVATVRRSRPSVGLVGPGDPTAS